MVGYSQYDIQQGRTYAPTTVRGQTWNSSSVNSSNSASSSSTSQSKGDFSDIVIQKDSNGVIVGGKIGDKVLTREQAISLNELIQTYNTTGRKALNALNDFNMRNMKKLSAEEAQQKQVQEVKLISVPTYQKELPFETMGNKILGKGQSTYYYTPEQIARAEASRPMTSYEKDLKRLEWIESVKQKHAEGTKRVKEAFDYIFGKIPIVGNTLSEIGQASTGSVTNTVMIAETLPMKEFLTLKYLFDSGTYKESTIEKVAEVGKEVGRSAIFAGETLMPSINPNNTVSAFNFATTRGRVNIGLTMFAIGSLGYSRAQSMKYTPKENTLKIKNPSYDKPYYDSEGNLNIVRVGKYTNKLGKEVNFDFRASIPEGGKGTFTTYYTDASGGLMRTQTGGITAEIVRNPINPDIAEIAGTISPKGQMPTKYIEQVDTMALNQEILPNNRFTYDQVVKSEGSIRGKVNLDYEGMAFSKVKGQGTIKTTETTSPFNVGEVPSSTSTITEIFPKTTQAKTNIIIDTQKPTMLPKSDMVGDILGVGLDIPISIPKTEAGSSAVPSASGMIGSDFSLYGNLPSSVIHSSAPTETIGLFIPSAESSSKSQVKLGTMTMSDIYPEVNVRTEIIPITEPLTGTITVPDININTETIVNNPNPIPPIIIIPPIRPRPPVLPPFFTLPQITGNKGFKRGSRGSMSRLLGYTPSITAIALNIKGRRIQEGGVGLRPIMTSSKKLKSSVKQKIKTKRFKKTGLKVFKRF